MGSTASILGILVAGLLPACGSDSGEDSHVFERATARDRGPRSEVTVGAWRIRATAEPVRLGPIGFAIENLVPDESNGRAWIEHDLVFRNAGGRPVTFADTRSSTFIGERDGHRLLAADAGCGYSREHPGSDVEAGACRLYLDLLTLKPHASGRRAITLYRGLPGMERLGAGTYVFRLPVRFQVGDRTPGENEGRSGVVRLVYEVLPRTE